MKKELYKYHSMIQALDCETGIQPDPPYVEENSEIANILREIFAPDVRTGLPQGEIAYYLSPDGNPQIKEWLLNNLLKARNVSVGPRTEGVTDDMLEEFSCGVNESLSDYRQRLYNIGLEAKQFIENNLSKEITEIKTE